MSHQVSEIRWRGEVKEVAFVDGTPALHLPRSACVTRGDHVVVDDGGARVVCENGSAQLLPLYVARERLQVGGLELEFVIKEITEAEEMAAFQALAQFHYRTDASLAVLLV
jgi:hypothetical protein